MFELIEIELTRVSRMAKQAGNDFLVYLIDMAIIEANAKARSPNNSLEAIILQSQEEAQRSIGSWEVITVERRP